MWYKVVRAATLGLLCVLVSSCQITASIQLPISTLIDHRATVAPVRVDSTKCQELGSSLIDRAMQLVMCNGGGGSWRGLIQVVDHNTKEMILKQPLSVYHGSSNGIVLFIREDALREVQGKFDTRDVKIQISLINDTESKQEVFVSNIWVNNKSVGSEGGVLVIPPNTAVVLELSDVATATLLSSGMESVGKYPIN